MKAHTVLAIAVLIGAGAWVATGKYSFVGSDVQDSGRAEAAVPAPTAAPEADRQTVAFAVARNVPYHRELRISGVTKPDKSTVLAARAAGVIAKLPVEKGAAVQEGDLLMALDGPEKYSAVAAAEALVEQRTKAAEADKSLLASGQVGRLRVDQSSADLVAARSALEAARADVDRLEVRAPFAALVDDVFVEQGSWVQPGADVASLIALDPIIAEGEISERDLAQVSVGAKAHVHFANGTEADGEVRYIRREASDLTRTFPLEVAIPNPDRAIPSGMSAEITIAGQDISSLPIPRSIITLGEDGAIGVRTLSETGVVAFQPVRIVDDTPKGLVVAGIEDGTRVIISGQDLVTAGQEVIGVDQTAMAEAWAGN